MPITLITVKTTERSLHSVVTKDPNIDTASDWCVRTRLEYISVVGTSCIRGSGGLISPLELLRAGISPIAPLRLFLNSPQNPALPP